MANDPRANRHGMTKDHITLIHDLLVKDGATFPPEYENAPTIYLANAISVLKNVPVPVHRHERALFLMQYLRDKAAQPLPMRSFGTYKPSKQMQHALDRCKELVNFGRSDNEPAEKSDVQGGGSNTTGIAHLSGSDARTPDDPLSVDTPLKDNSGTS